jgi:LEA14-like dessication related protein
MIPRRHALAFAAFAALALSGCATLRGDPPQVTVAGIEPLQGEGMEMRMLVKLRVQNPNDAAIDYDGASVQLDVFGKSFASGVSDAAGTVPRFGESVVAIPVTVSMMAIARQALGMMNEAKMPEKVPYELSGKLSGSAFSSVRFRSKGELELPKGAGAVSPPAR